MYRPTYGICSALDQCIGIFQTLLAMNCERKRLENCDWVRAEPSLLELCRALAIWTKSMTGILIAGGFQALGILQLHNNGVCKDANRWWGLPFRVFQTQFLCLVNYSTGLKTRGYSPLRDSRLPDAFEPLSNERWVVSVFDKNFELTTPKWEYK